MNTSHEDYARQSRKCRWELTNSKAPEIGSLRIMGDAFANYYELRKVSPHYFVAKLYLRTILCVIYMNLGALFELSLRRLYFRVRVPPPGRLSRFGAQRAKYKKQQQRPTQTRPETRRPWWYPTPTNHNTVPHQPLPPMQC